MEERLTIIASDPELGALRAVIASDLPAYLADLEHLVNIDCGSYTPAGVNEPSAATCSPGWAGATRPGNCCAPR